MVDQKQIRNLLKQYFKVTGKVTINAQGMVDVTGDIGSKDQFDQLPVQFHHVTGHCLFHDSSLTSLAGAPAHVGGSFWCDNNKLTSLAGAPVHVGADFTCNHNQLTSLEGAPHHVGGDFFCDNNKLTSLAGLPAHVGRGIFCSDNNITSLEGAPVHVVDVFYCQNNPLTSLEGAPVHVGGSFECSYSEHLPLLRLCNYAQIEIEKAPNQVVKILKKYAGKGKPGAIKAAAELVKAGYKENARW